MKLLLPFREEQTLLEIDTLQWEELRYMEGEED